MWKYIFRTTWTYLLALLLISFIFYTLYTQFKGNPYESQFETYASRNDLAGYYNLLALNGVDKSPVERYGVWLADFFQGSWGKVFDSTNSQFRSAFVPDVFFTSIRTSAQVLVPSYFIALIIGFPLGVLLGYQFASRTRRGRFIDSSIGGVIQLLNSVPTFIWAIFALLLGPIILLPTTYNVDNGIGYQIRSLVLPILILVIVSLVDWSIRLRIEVANVLISDYILAAKARGFSRWAIFYKYVLRNALYPYVGSLFASFLIVFGGSLIIERYFAIPGLAEPLVVASNRGEVNILMFNLVFFGFIGALSNIFQQACQLSIDPRVRSQLGQDYKILTQAKAYVKRRKDRNFSKASEAESIVGVVGENAVLNAAGSYSVASSNSSLVKLSRPSLTSLVISGVNHKSNKTRDAQEFNSFYKLNISSNSFVKLNRPNLFNELVGKPRRNITQTAKRFLTKPSSLISLLVIILLIVMSVVIPLTSAYGPASRIYADNSTTVGEIGSFSRLPASGTWVTRTTGTADLIRIFNARGFVEGVDWKYLGTQSPVLPPIITYDAWKYAKLLDPSLVSESLIGTNALAQDIWTRAWAGTARSIGLGFAVGASTMFIGLIAGSVAGLYYGSWFDIALMRFVDAYSNIPQLVVIIIVASIFPQSFIGLFILFVMLQWPGPLSVSRLNIVRFTNTDYIKVAKASGVSVFGLIFKHALPNFVGIMALVLFGSVSLTIVNQAYISVIGIPFDPISPYLGNVIDEMSREAIGGVTENLAYLLFPCALLIAISLSLRYVGVGINDAVDPKFSRR